ncbi:MAG: substrate-binding domain-containing protein [Thermus sp.]|uniref:autoinducer 2 ABC transporter substrate-binding protein n=1 Tax=Thermus sp. TaxID=275 RepID=UPI00351B5C65
MKRMWLAGLVFGVVVGLGYWLAVLDWSVAQAQQRTLTIAMIPKVVGIDYFNATRMGAEQAVRELGGIRFIHQGPTEARVDRQIELIENFITARVDVIAVASNDPVAIAPALQKAQRAGIKVVTYDADANARDVFVNQATFEGIGKALVDEMVKQVGPNAEVAIVTSSLTAPNQNAWIAAMKAYMAQRYPNLKVVDLKPSEEDQQLAFQVTQDLLKAHPTLKGVWALSSVAFPGAAEAVKQAGKCGQVAVVGLSTPKQMRPYVKEGCVKSVVLWNPVDLGYLTIYTAKQLAEKGLKPGDKIVTKRGTWTVEKDKISLQVLLGPPFIFTAENIDKFDF